MIYAYIRVSTDKQTVENQRFEIENYCRKRQIDVDQYIEETISGMKDVDKRKLGILLNEDEEGRYPYSLGNIQTGQTVAGGYVHSRQSDEEENPSNNREGRL